MTDFATLEARPDGIGVKTFEKLQRQARMQLDDKDGPPQFEVIDAGPLHRLPDPSPGDLFFDYEGDPLFDDGAGSYGSLEYLWGFVMADREPPNHFDHFWADNRVEEQRAFDKFMAMLEERRSQFPGMHIYHYAPYEITALKRLSGAHGRHQEMLDDLLREGVFVDLYRTVRNSLCVSQPSYSIKYLEPLYALERDGAVNKGDDSVAFFHEYLALVGSEDEASTLARDKLKKDILDYNQVDCESTRELRDWLLSVRGQAMPSFDSAHQPEVQPEPQERQDPPSEHREQLKRLSEACLERAGAPDPDGTRTPEGRAWSLMAAICLYHRREELPTWWDYYRTLSTPLEDLDANRNVFVPALVEADSRFDFELTNAGQPFKNRGMRRDLSLRGQVPEGSEIERVSSVRTLYSTPWPEATMQAREGVLSANEAMQQDR